MTIAFPDRYHRRESWDESGWSFGLTPAGAFTRDRDSARRLTTSQRQALQRELCRLPFVLLRNRNRPGFVALASGAARVGDSSLEFVTVALGGATTRLGIEPKSGRVVSAAYRGRGPRMLMGDLEISYSDFRAVGGLTLPHAWTVRFDGRPAPTLDVKLTRVTTDGPLDPALFELPAER